MSAYFAIVPDITCDLSSDIREKYDIDFVPGHFSVSGKEYCGSLKWDFSDRHEFYESLRKSPSGFKTSPPNVAEFEAVFEKYAKDNIPVLCPVISSGMSGTYNFAVQARDRILKKYHDTKIAVLDSLRFSAAMGLMAVNASIMRQKGMSFEEVVKALEESKLGYHQIGWLDDLPFSAKQGRINNSAAFFGTLIGIKPLGDIDTNGMTTVVGKAKGEKNAYNAILSYVEKTGLNLSEQSVIISHSDREKNAVELKKMIEERFKVKEVLMTTVFPSCGVSIGPGLMAVYYVGKPVEQGLGKEKEIMKECLV